MQSQKSLDELKSELRFECGQLNLDAKKIIELSGKISDFGEKIDLVFRDRQFGSSLSLEGLSGVRRVFFKNCSIIEVSIFSAEKLEEVVFSKATLNRFTANNFSDAKIQFRESVEVKYFRIDHCNRIDIEFLNNATIDSMEFDSCSFKASNFLSPSSELVNFTKCKFLNSITGNFSDWMFVNSHKKIHFKGCSFDAPFNLKGMSGPVLELVEFVECKFVDLSLTQIQLKKIDLANSTVQNQISLECASVDEIILNGIKSKLLIIQGNAKKIFAQKTTLENFIFRPGYVEEADFSESAISISTSIVGGEVVEFRANFTRFLTSLNLTSVLIKKLLQIESAFVAKLFASKLVLEGRSSFNRSIFEGAPDFRSTDFSQDTDFIDAIFLDLKSDSAEAYYRDLKQKMDAKHNEQARTQFASLELGCRKFKLPWLNFERICSEIYWLFNGYGQKSFRPVIWLVLLCASLVPVYSTGGRVVPNSIYLDKKYSGTWLGELHSASIFEFACAPFLKTDPIRVEIKWAGVVYSFLNSLGPLRLLTIGDSLVPKNSFIQLLGLVQSIISSVLLYLLISNIKRKLSITG